jgi:hypothetical protein
MADVFISFRTDDTPRVKPIRDAFLARGLTVFWSNDIPKGAPNYQAVIKEELIKAPIVAVVWTNASVHSGPVVQECSQAERHNKLFQILLDDIEPIDFPMEVRFKAQKTMLQGWSGNIQHPEWLKLTGAIDGRLGRDPVPPRAMADRADSDITRLVNYLADEFQKEQSIDLRRNKLALQRLKEAAEKAKIDLSSTAQTEINLYFIAADARGPKHLTMKLTRAKFLALMRHWP